MEYYKYKRDKKTKNEKGYGVWIIIINVKKYTPNTKHYVSTKDRNNREMELKSSVTTLKSK